MVTSNKYEVKHTTNYNQFKVMPGNRPIFPGHISLLAESFHEHPNLVELRPVLANERLEVVDGQHRLQAARQAGLPVPYQVVPRLDLTVAQLLNGLQRPWRLQDFAHSYAYSGSRDYQHFVRLLEEYKLSPTTLLLYVFNSDRWREFHKFKKGQFKMPEEVDEIEERLAKLASFEPFGIPWRTTRFTRAFLIALHVPGYDHARMLRNMAVAHPENQPDKRDWLRELERVYNFNAKDVVRFF